MTPNILEAKGVQVTREGKPERVYRLNAGCGRRLYPDCANVDISEKVGADFLVDFDDRGLPWPFEDDTFDSVYCSHTIEHIHDPLWFMQELHRVCVNGAVAIFKLPYGASDNAWEDPTHRRPYYLDSFGYFSQAAYTGADYGYRGDWTIVDRALQIFENTGLEVLKDRLDELHAIVMTQRNVVEEFKVIVKCVKPIRTPGTFKETAPISFAFHRPKNVVKPGPTH